MNRLTFKSVYIPWATRVFLAIFLLITVIFAVTITILTNLLSNEITDIETQTIEKHVKQTSDMLDQICLVQLQKADHLLADDEFFTMLKTQEQQIGEQYRLKRDLSQKLNQSETQLEIAYRGYPEDTTYYVNSYFSVLTDNPSLLPSKDSGNYLNRIEMLSNKSQEGWYQELMEKGQSFAWGDIQTIYGLEYLTGYRKIIDISDFSVLGVLRIHIPLSAMRTAIKNNSNYEECQIFYLDPNRKNLFTFGQMDSQQQYEQVLTAQQAKEDGIVYCESESQLTGNTLVALFSKETVLRKFHQFYGMLLWVMVLIFLGGMPILFFISRHLTKRIRCLSEKTKLLAKGDFSVVSQTVYGHDEISDLEYRFNDMVLQLKRMIQNEVRFKEQIEEMKVELLQEQINPHLLYNTLAMIRYQAKMANLSEMADLSNHLIIFYRRFLNEGNYISTISSELMMIEQYVEVVKKVYSLELTVLYQIPEEIKQFYAVKLFLQPVVENAIVHGIRSIGCGVLKITAVYQDKRACFEIRDNGCGIEKENLEELRTILAGQGSREHLRSVGLYNVSQRIRLLYGSQYGLEIDSIPGEGTVVRVSIPLMDEQEKQNFIQEHGLNL